MQPLCRKNMGQELDQLLRELDQDVAVILRIVLLCGGLAKRLREQLAARFACPKLKLSRVG
jgi:hypothetical protein